MRYTRCSEHGTRAAWACTSCERTLCPDCATNKLWRGGDKIDMCMHCGGFARRLTVPIVIEPFWVSWPKFKATFVWPDSAIGAPRRSTSEQSIKRH